VQDRWRALVLREGTVKTDRPGAAPVDAGAAAGAAAGDGHEPCPACGTTAPLVAGACSDCGLQLA
jgi:hypothetical protein